MHCKICNDLNCELISDHCHLVSYPTREDINGNFHNHDKNGRWQEWKCSKGHDI